MISGVMSSTCFAQDREGPLDLPPDAVVDTQATNGQTPGRTPGSFQVSSSGAALYTIPLWVSPGRAGIQPELSLQYDSFAGEGLLGMGWNLRGLPRIVRCNRTVADDRYAAPINFLSSDDSLCLDGERLVLVHGEHMMQGAEYRTAHDNFLKVIANAPDSLGVASFTAFLKDGKILTFGATLDGPQVKVSAPQPNGSIYTSPNILTTNARIVRLAWAVSLVADRNGNTMKINYCYKVESNDEWVGASISQLPDTIEYTGSTQGDTPTRTVKFFYETEQDGRSFFVSFGYVSGFPQWNHWRLDHIEMWGPNPTTEALLRSYNFAYQIHSVTDRAVLSSLTEKDGRGIALGSTAFGWAQAKSVEYEITDLGINDISHDPRYRWIEPLDVNGDGKTDLLYIPWRGDRSADTYFVRFSNGTTFGDPVDTGLKHPENGHPPFAININNDGRDDMLVYSDPSTGGSGGPTSAVVCAAVNTGNDTAPMFTLSTCLADRQGLAGDLNGDGLTDILGYLPGDKDKWTYLMNWYYDGFDQIVKETDGPFDTVPSLIGPNKWELDVVDVDGAGADSLIGWKDPADDRRSIFTYGRSPGIDGSYLSTLYTGTTLYWTDVNGDGLLDAVAWGAAGKPEVYTFLNTGNGFAEHNGIIGSDGNPEYFVSDLGEPTLGPITSSFTDPGIRVFDFDGDGRGDIILRAGSYDKDNNGNLTGITFGDHVLIMRSVGSTFVPVRGLASRIPSPIRFSDANTLRDSGLIQPVDVNGDGLDDLVLYDNGSLFLYTHKGEKPDMLTGIRDGFGAITTVRYEPISNRDVYTPGKDCRYPVTCLNAKLWVVAESSVSSGNGGQNTSQYVYSDGRRDLRGQGFLGMSSRTVTYVPTGETEVTTYDLRPYRSMSLYPFIGLPASKTVTVPLENGRVHTNTVNTTYVPHIDENTKIYFAVAQTIDDQDSETGTAGSTVLRTIHIVQDIDDFGNIIDLQRTTGDGETYAYHADYENSTADWLIQRPLLVTETSTSANHESATRRRAFSWDGSGLLHQEIIEPGEKSGDNWLPRVPSGPNDDGVKTLYVTHDRYPNGLIKRTTRDESMSPTSPTVNQRYVEYTYADPDQVFPSSNVDAMGHKIRTAYHPGIGSLAASDDYNGVLSKWQVDGFGRLRHEEVAGGESRDVNYTARAGGPAEVPLLEIGEALGSGPTRVTGYDMIGRAIARQVLTRKDGQPVVLDLKYDDAGRGLNAISIPHFVTETPVYTTYDYDSLGRVRLLHQPDGTAIMAQYDGLTAIHFDAKQNERRQVYDQSGRVVKSLEITTPTATMPSRQIPTTYSYGPFSELETVTDAKDNLLRIGNDRLGRRIHIDDADAGLRDFTYTAFGEVHTETVNQSSPGPAVTTFTYDKVGRITEINSPDGVTKRNWDSAVHGVGFLDTSLSPDGVATSNSYYDSGLLQSCTRTLRNQSFTITREYDSHGRLKTLTYPAVPGRSEPFAVDFKYVPAGNLDSIVNHATQVPYYALLDSDATGNPTNPSGEFPQEQFGNDLISRRIENPLHRGYLERIETLDSNRSDIQRLDLHFDPNGNLDQRTDEVVGSSETFGYDASNRLSTWMWLVGAVSRNVQFGYDDLGNFRSRMVTEDPSANVNYSYDSTNGAGPHGVTAMNGLKMSYDERGEQISGPNRALSYTGFELPATITAPSGNFRFGYDADQRRISKTGPSGDEFITIGGFYERHTQAAQVDHVFTIMGWAGPAVQVIWSQTDNTFAPDRVFYLHTDHLGSVDTITDDKGNLGERLKYDPFGKRVEPTHLDHQLSASALGERLGFTGHEHDDDLGLINMKGRIYDPLLGRFLTADPIVSHLVYGQAYNPYSYVLNNPLSVTDQTGLQDDRERDTWPAFSGGGGWLYYSSSIQLEQAVSKAGIFTQSRTALKSNPKLSGRLWPEIAADPNRTYIVAGALLRQQDLLTTGEMIEAEDLLGTPEAANLFRGSGGRGIYSWGIGSGGGGNVLLPLREGGVIDIDWLNSLLSHYAWTPETASLAYLGGKPIWSIADGIAERSFGKFWTHIRQFGVADEALAVKYSGIYGFSGWKYIDILDPEVVAQAARVLKEERQLRAKKGIH